MTEDQIRNELNRRKRGIKIELARRDFYEYCRITSPDFYKPDRLYLKKLCNKLQQFYECRLLLPTGEICRRLMIAMPPRHGKTRTLTKFSAWVLGKDKLHKTITAAYNDTLAYDFSKYTRDEIKEEKSTPEEIVYSDIFPETFIRRGSSSMKQWAIAGAHFSYKGAGVGGTITGKGGNILIIDDPVKDADTAFSEDALEKLWKWYTGTWLSRKESNALEIITHTPWAKKDISGRILDGNLKDKWYVIATPAVVDQKKKIMLCSEILSYEAYTDLKNSMDPLIFSANYDLIRLDKIGMMYSGFKTYNDLPDYDFDEKLFVADTAGKGEDNFCGIYGNIYKGIFYVIDVYFTDEDIDITEKETARRLIQYKMQTAYIESNSAGHSFAYHVEKILADDYCWYGTNLVEFVQSKNKEARIFSKRIQVMNRIIMPVDWRIRWPDFYSAVMTYSKIGKNKHDDGPDALTIVSEYLDGQYVANVGINHSVA